MIQWRVESKEGVGDGEGGNGDGETGREGQWGGREGWETVRGRSSGKGREWGGGDVEVRLGGGNVEGEIGRGQQEGVDGERGQRGGGEEGARRKGISQMDMMKCLGGMRLQFFLTLFTLATPGTPASIYNI